MFVCGGCELLCDGVWCECVCLRVGVFFSKMCLCVFACGVLREASLFVCLMFLICLVGLICGSCVICCVMLYGLLFV